MSVPTLIGIAWLAPGDERLATAAPWFPTVVAASLLSVRVWGTVSMDMSLPVLLAAGIVLGGPVAGLLALVGSISERELRREVGLTRAIFDRCQVAVSVLVAASVYHAIAGSTYALPDAALAFTPALLADFLVNVSLVVVVSRLTTGVPWRAIVGGLLGSPPAEALTYLCLGSIALVLVPLYEFAGTWGLVAGMAPLLLAHQLFLRGQKLREASRAVETMNRALVDVSGRIAEERRDERLCIAGALHDEVLQPLYKVHLMGEVLRRDLSSGRLLDLEDDLPGLLEATRVAQDALRRVVRDLRDSSLGPGGLHRALKALVRNAEGSCRARISAEVDEVDGPPLVQLLAYQIVREALQNALKYSSASAIRVLVKNEGDAIRLLVEDDGQGFSPLVVDSQNHFGLQLMRERAEAAGGHLCIDSAPGAGTRVVARLPLPATTDRP
ncbi:MAG TPA: ATP-binding protein [Actinomycetota bacterium]|nr:ATP-binding protein [Actinomycetota bacterium]